MKKALLGTALCACLLMAGMASAQLTSIDAIQAYNPATGAPASPYAGQVVTVEGVIYMVKGTFNGGSHYIQGADGGIQFYWTAAPATVLGERIQLTGTVSSNSGEIQIASPTNLTSLGVEAEVTPIELTIPQILTDYENVGNFVTTTGYIASVPPLTGNRQFFLHDGAGDTVIVFIDTDTGIDTSALALGDYYRISSPCVMFNGTVELKPRKQADLVENPANPAPTIDNVNSTNWAPTSTQPFPVSADITDNGTITGAKLWWRNSAGDGLGTFSSVTMTHGAGNSWSANVPTPHSLRQIDFYVEATDNDAQTTLNPASAPAAFYSAAVGITRIYDVQYVHPDSVSQSSPLNGKVVNIRGVVTAGTGDVGAVSKFVLEEAVGGPFTGILVYEGSGTYGTVLPGDLVRVGGYIEEFFGETEMAPHNGTAVYIESFGNDLPPTQYVSTRVLADHFSTDGNGRLGEAYESVWVRTRAAAVLDTLGTRRYLVSDTGATADSLMVQPYIALTYQPIPGDNVIVAGFMEDSGGIYRLRPIRDEDITSGLTGVGDTTPQLLPAGGFVGVSPNPFNPRTEIEFALTRANLVQLNVYNLRGQMVRSLVNGRLEAGSYPVVWDGTDNAGNRMGSGTYFARLRIGAEVMQVEKLSLVK